MSGTVPGMDDLVVWLRQQLDEDERGIQDLTRPVTEPLPSSRRDVHEWVLEAAPEKGITRIRLEAAAKRRILDVLEEQRRQAERNSHKYVEAMRSPRGGPADDLLPGIKTHGWTLGGRIEALEEVVKLLALPYSGRPGYREEWKP